MTMIQLHRVVACIPASIHTKLLTAFLVIVGLLIVVGTVGLQVLSSSHRRAENLVQLQRKIAAYQQLQHDATAQLHSIASALLVPNERTLNAALRQLKQFGYDFDRLQFIAKDETEILKRVQKAHEDFVHVVNLVVDLIRDDKVDESRELQHTRAGPLAARLERHINTLVNKASEDMVAHTDASQKAYTVSQQIVVGFAIGSMGLALVLGYALSGSLIGPVQIMEGRMRQIALGNFSERVELPNRDELGAFATNLNQMNDDLKKLYQERDLYIRFLRQTFGRYLSDDVVNSLLDSPTGLELGGVKRKVTLLMSDLRGFTTLSEHLQPEQVVTLLNRYLGIMADIILKYQGTIDEFIGDAIFVIFGAPVQRDDDAQRAVACATEMQLAMERINAHNHRDGLPGIAMGIGINTGEVVVGNIGSDKRAKYGVVGRHVNLTSRIESCTVGSQILISEATYEEVGSLVTISGHMQISAKGIEDLIELYEVRGVSGSYNYFLSDTEDVLLPLPVALPLQYTILEGKHLVETAQEGSLVKVSLRGGEIRSDHILEPLSNIKIQLTDIFDHEVSVSLYGKVLTPDGTYATSFPVRFTSVSPEAAPFLERLVTSCHLPTTRSTPT